MAETILIIDDDLTTRSALARALEAAGYLVEVADDGVDGSRQISAVKPHLIILDALLPRRDGFELCVWLKSDPRLKSTPVILLSSVHLTEEEKQHGLEVGSRRFVFQADSILSKPIRPENVLCEVAKLLGRGAEARPQSDLDKILVIDPDEANARVVERWFARDGHLVAVATSAVEGIEKSFSEDPDLILLAATMPDQNGPELVEQLRAHHGNDVAIVLMAQVGEGNIVAKAMQAGANDYIRKPVNFSQLSTLVLHDLDEYHARMLRRRMLRQLKSTSLDLMRKVQELQEERRRVLRSHRYAQAILQSLGEELEIITSDRVEEYVTGSLALPSCCVQMGATTPASNCPVPRAYRSGRPCSAEISGAAGRTVLCSATPVVDPQGRRVVVRMVRDLTERRAAEHARHDSQKMVTIGMLARHGAELHRRLSEFVRDHAQAALAGAPGTDPIAALQRVLAAVSVPDRFIQGLEQLVESAKPCRKAVDLQPLLDSVIELAERCYGKPGCPVEKSIVPATVSADAGQLEQAFMNLLSNAHEAAGASARLAVNMTTDAGSGRVCIRFEDSGPGISMANRQFLFEPFFTTKLPTPGNAPSAHLGVETTGLGLGLAVAKSIIVDHGGDITVEDSPLGGAAFVVWLPLIDQPTEQPEPVAVGASETDL